MEVMVKGKNRHPKIYDPGVTVQIEQFTTTLSHVAAEVFILCKKKCSTSAARFFAASGEALFGPFFSWSC